MKRERKKVDKTTVQLIALFSVIALVVAFFVVYFNLRVEKAYTEAVSCKVVDKYHLYGIRMPRSHYLTLQVQVKHGEFEEVVYIPRNTFYNVSVGDLLPCEVLYDEEGVINITILEPDASADSQASVKK